jgi:drug/metabolite transporter (DMT)-like permease
MHASAKPPRWQTLLAFAIIYFVWGSTFLAIRIGVREVPPFLFAAMRFFTAGLLLFVWTRAKGTPFPRAREWASASLLGLVIFVLDYGSLFWAEKRVPSGIAAVMLALIPGFMALSEIIFLKTQKLTVRLVCAMLAGVTGVAVLVNPFVSLGQTPIDLLGATALVVASISWSIAAVLTRRLQLPESKVMSSSTQMLTGGFFLMITAALLGNFEGFSVSKVPVGVWIALAYLIVAGSIVAFTAYVWLIHHESPTRVGTYAYVNPVIAVLLGYFFGGEMLGPRTVAGTILVLLSVVLITTSPKNSSVASESLSQLEQNCNVTRTQVSSSESAFE